MTDQGQAGGAMTAWAAANTVRVDGIALVEAEGGKASSDESEAGSDEEGAGGCPGGAAIFHEPEGGNATTVQGIREVRLAPAWLPADEVLLDGRPVLA
jgi:hypothetical protein